MEVVSEIMDFVSRSLRGAAERSISSSITQGDGDEDLQEVLRQEAETIVAQLFCSAVDSDVNRLEHLIEVISERQSVCHFHAVPFALLPYSLLHYAAVASSPVPMEKILFHERALRCVAPLDPNAACVGTKFGSGCTPLHLAAILGSVNIAKVLIVSGADVRSLRNRSVTVLHDAVRKTREVIEKQIHKERRGFKQIRKMSLTPSPERLMSMGRLFRSSSMLSLTPLHRSDTVSAESESIATIIRRLSCKNSEPFALCVLLVGCGSDSGLHSTPTAPLSSLDFQVLHRVSQEVDRRMQSQEGVGLKALQSPLLQSKRLYEAVVPSYAQHISGLIEDHKEKSHAERVERMAQILVAPRPPPVTVGDYVKLLPSAARKYLRDRTVLLRKTNILNCETGEVVATPRKGLLRRLSHFKEHMKEAATKQIPTAEPLQQHLRNVAAKMSSRCFLPHVDVGSPDCICGEVRYVGPLAGVTSLLEIHKDAQSRWIWNEAAEEEFELPDIPIYKSFRKPSPKSAPPLFVGICVSPEHGICDGRYPGSEKRFFRTMNPLGGLFVAMEDVELMCSGVDIAVIRHRLQMADAARAEQIFRENVAERRKEKIRHASTHATRRNMTSEMWKEIRDREQQRQEKCNARGR